MPFDLSFIGRGLLPFQGSANTTPDVPGAVPGASDPQDELLQQLLAGLGTTIPEPTPPQMAPQPSGGRQILGSIGDALLAMAAIKAGGRPQAMGPFASRQHEATQMARLQQQEYERRREEVAIANQTMKRQTLIGLMAERGKNRIGPLDQEKLAIERAKLAEDTRYHTGQLAKPAKTKIHYDHDQQGNLVKITTGGGPGGADLIEPVGNITKPPNPAVMGNMISTSNVLLDLDQMETLLDNATANQTLGGRLVGAGSQSIPGVRTIAGYVNPQAQAHEALRAKLVLELNRPITQQNRLLQAEVTQMLKNVPDFGTNPIVYKQLLHNLRTSIQNIDRVQTHAYPVEARAMSSQEPVGGQWTGIVLHEADFANASPGERERFLAGGGRIEP